MDVSSSRSTWNNWHLTLKLNTLRVCTARVFAWPHLLVCILVCPSIHLIVWLTAFFYRVIVSLVRRLCVCSCLFCVRVSTPIHCLSSPNDDVETKHFWPAFPTPRCGETGFLVLPWCFVSHGCNVTKTVLSSTEQMALYGVGSVYYGKRGQKALSVEWFLSMQAKHIHICCAHLVFHVKYSSYSIYICTTHNLHSHAWLNELKP